MSHRSLTGLVAVALAGAVTAAEFPVNTQTIGNQSRSSIAGDSGGYVTVAWQSDVEPGGDGTGVFARRFAWGGGTAGVTATDSADFRISTGTAGSQMTPQVAMDWNDGRFFAVWQTISGTSQTVTTRGLGGEYTVGTGTTSLVRPMGIGQNSSPGGWGSGVVWENDAGFHHRYVDISGVMGHFATFPPMTANGNHHVRVSTRYGGGTTGIMHVMAYDSGSSAADVYDHPIGGDGGTTTIRAAAVVNTNTTGLQQKPAVSIAPDGSYVVVWEDHTATDGVEVVAQRFDAAGNKVGGNFVVNTNAAGDQMDPVVRHDAYGNFLVVWASNHTGDYDVMARRFAPNGVASTGELLVNTTTAGAQTEPSVARVRDSSFAIAWTSAGQDGDGEGIFAGVLHFAVYPGSTLEVSPQHIRADGSDSATVTLTAKSASGVAAGTGGAIVVMTTSLGTLTPVVDHGDGTYSARLTGTTPGSAAIRATIDGVPASNSGSIYFWPFPIVAFSATAYYVNEVAGPARIVLSRTGHLDYSSSVTFATGSGSAVAGTNYSPVTQTVSFAPGTSTAEVHVPVMSDGDGNGARSLSVTISDPSIATIGSPSSATLSIVDAAVNSSDADADGMSDVVWWNRSEGNATLWLMNGVTVSSAVSKMPIIGAPAHYESPFGGDFNGDGSADVVYETRESAGRVTIVFLRDGAILRTASVTFAGSIVHPAGWDLIAARDFDGDRKSDLALRNASGEVVIWFLDGSAIRATATIAVPPPIWSLVGTGDLNGDSHADLVWRNADTNEVAVWTMAGGSISTAAIVAVPPSPWLPVGVADIFGDGSSSILWLNSDTREFVQWRMSGASIVSASWLATPPSGWSLAGIGDFDGDRRADLLWRNSGTGSNAVWLMNGASIAAAAYTEPMATSIDWMVVAPR